MSDIFDDLFEPVNITALRKLEKTFILPDIVQYCYDKAIEHHKIALKFQEDYLYYKQLRERRSRNDFSSN